MKNFSREYGLRSIKWRVVRTLHPVRSVARRLLASRRTSTRLYRWWIRRYDSIPPNLRAALAADVANWPSQTLISVIMPSYNIDPRWMTEAIESVRNQIYPHWELCISDDASTVIGIRSLLERYAAQDSRIHVAFRRENGHISANSNTALKLAKGDYLVLMDADDLLSEDALFWVAREIATHPDVDLIFSDEDKIDANGKRSDPYFKSAWNPALMLSQNAFSHLGAYRRSLVEEIGGFREGYEGAEDHDLVLRCAERTTVQRIRHIPRVLYHWRTLPSSAAAEVSVKSYAWESGKTAIADHLRRLGTRAQIKPALTHYYQVEYELPKPEPFVSLVVPTTLSVTKTAQCLGSVLTRSTYQHFELLLLAHADNLRAAKSTPDFAEIVSHPRVRLIEYSERPYNFSRVSNLGTRLSRGDLICFLNDDVEVVTPDWLERLASRASLEGVGAVGGMLYYPSDSIQHAGVILGIDGVAEHVSKHRQRGYPGHFGRGALEQNYSCVTAACMMVKRSAFEMIGGFDETLPVAFNDIDLCIRIREAGARIVWTPAVEMYHHESLTLGHHISPARRDQFLHDVREIRARWNGVLAADPCYNPNLSLAGISIFELGWPPRVPSPKDVVTSPTRISISRTSELPVTADCTREIARQVGHSG